MRTVSRSSGALRVIALTLAIGTALCLCLSSAAEAAKWSAQSLTVAESSQSELFGIDCYSSTACTAVGHDNVVHFGSFGETWNGSGWTKAGVKHVVFEKNDVLRSVSCVGATTCVAVGSYGFGVPYPLAQTQGEPNWKVWEVGMPKGATQADLNDVSCLEPSEGGIWCMAVGYKMVGGDDKPYAVNFNGLTWTESTTATEHNSALKGVSCLSTSFCMAVGSTTPEGKPGKLLAEFWEGKGSEEKWVAPEEAQPPLAGSGTEPVLNGVDCIEQSGHTEETEGHWCMTVGKEKRSPGGSQPIAPDWHRGTGGKYQWYSGSEPKHESSTEVVADGVSCLAITECFAVGEANSGATKSPWADKWNNEGWEKAETIPLAVGSSGAQLHDISCYAELSCKAVGWSLFPTPTALVDTSTP